MNIDQIIGKVLGDGPSGEEKAALDTWKKEAEDNIKALEDIRKIAALSDEYLQLHLHLITTVVSQKIQNSQSLLLC